MLSGLQTQRLCLRLLMKWGHARDSRAKAVNATCPSSPSPGRRRRLPLQPPLPRAQTLSQRPPLLSSPPQVKAAKQGTARGPRSPPQRHGNLPACDRQISCRKTRGDKGALLHKMIHSNIEHLLTVKKEIPLSSATMCFPKFSTITSILCGHTTQTYLSVPDQPCVTRRQSSGPWSSPGAPTWTHFGH